MLENKGTKCYTAAECYNNENGASRSYNLAEGISMDILYNKFYFEAAKDENDYSVCTMFNYNDQHFMLTGDLEHHGEEEMAKYYDGSTPEKTLPHVALFKAGHHGSVSSSNECLLELITPEIVTICCCAGSTEYTANYNNIFPTQEFITRIAKYTDQVYATSLFNEKTLKFESFNGNIIVSCNGTNVAVSATNNTTKLKDSDWFNETVYVDFEGNICSGKGKEDFFTADTPGVTAVPRRVWPTGA
jgi:beta-lactamase superfamily II metal-dependent hydrolase